MIIEFNKNNYKCTLKETSKDDNGNFYLIDDSDIEVYNFDKIKKYVSKKLRGKLDPSSSDAFYYKNENEAYLIEFKNQPHQNVDTEGIRKKAYDNIFLLLLTFYPDLTVEELTKKLVFIVVFNENKNNDDLSTKMNISKNYNNIVDRMAELAGKKGMEKLPVYYELDRIKGNLYKEIFTVDVEVFNSQLKNIIFN